MYLFYLTVVMNWISLNPVFSCGPMTRNLSQLWVFSILILVFIFLLFDPSDNSAKQSIHYQSISTQSITVNSPLISLFSLCIHCDNIRCYKPSRITATASNCQGSLKDIKSVQSNSLFVRFSHSLHPVCTNPNWNKSHFSWECFINSKDRNDVKCYCRNAQCT